MEGLSALAAGKVGEYLTCAEIILRGHTAFLSEQGLPFDVVADVDGRLLRVQVKTTRGPRKVPNAAHHTPAYIFHIKRCGKGGRGTYLTGDVDLFALVALDSRAIGFLPAHAAKQSMVFRSAAYRGEYFDEVLRARAEQIHALRADGMIAPRIAEALSLHQSYVYRVLKAPPSCIATLETYLENLTFANAIASLTPP